MITRTSLETLAIAAVIVCSAPTASPQPLPGPQPSTGPIVSFGRQEVSASRITPNADAVLFGVARVAIRGGAMTKIVRWHRIVATDRAGLATFDLGMDVPLFSVWAVVDARSGQFTIAALPGYAVREIPVSSISLLRGASVDRFLFDRSYLDLLYVHPGKGAWYWSEMSGTSTDKSAVRGKTAVSAEQAISMAGGGDKPKDFSPGGVLIAVDFMHLEVTSARVENLPIGVSR